MIWINCQTCITFPRQERDIFIFLASSKFSPETCVFDIFSDPARSTKLRIPFLSDWLLNLYWISKMKILWLLELWEFILVLETLRFLFPSSITSINSSAEETYSSVIPSIYIPRKGDYFIFNSTGSSSSSKRRSINFYI